MNQSIKRDLPFFMMCSFFILIDGLALLLTNLFRSTGVIVYENPNDPLNLVYFFLTLLLSTGIILLISKVYKRQIVKVIFLGAIGLLLFNIFFLLFANVTTELWSISFSILITITLIIMLIKYPEWYIVDACGIIVGVGSIALFGISLSIFLVIILLVGMAIYDAISVYTTKHMIELTETGLKLKLPVILVIPKSSNYSLIKDTRSLKGKLNEEERSAFIIGLGDIVFPGILVSSTYYNISNNGLLIAVSTILGTLLGLSVLIARVVKGKPQAGLPYLCSGALLGYFFSSYLLYGSFKLQF